MGEVKNVSISLQPWLLWSGEGRGGADLKLVQWGRRGVEADKVRVGLWRRGEARPRRLARGGS